MTGPLILGRRGEILCTLLRSFNVRESCRVVPSMLAFRLCQLCPRASSQTFERLVSPFSYYIFIKCLLGLYRSYKLQLLPSSHLPRLRLIVMSTLSVAEYSTLNRRLSQLSGDLEAFVSL